MTDRRLPRIHDRARPQLGSFLVDWAQMQGWTSGVPRSSMYLYVNAWFPSWLAGGSPAADQSTLVDWIT